VSGRPAGSLGETVVGDPAGLERGAGTSAATWPGGFDWYRFYVLRRAALNERFDTPLDVLGNRLGSSNRRSQPAKLVV
jgi:hypothetical protein